MNAVYESVARKEQLKNFRGDCLLMIWNSVKWKQGR